jgi:phosphoadenosine phosphosulfate reductase
MALDRERSLRSLIDRAADELGDADALEILRWADKMLRQRVVVTTSLQDAVLVDLAARARPGIDVIFLDTGYHFAETLGMRDAVRSTYDVRLLSVEPGQSVAEQDGAHGKDLFGRNPDLCCHLRKVVPLNTMLGLYDGWVTGLRRAESMSRKDATAIEWDSRREMVKINPIVNWTDDEVEDYIEERSILVNPLRAEGYPSIGCAPCTIPVAEGDDPRSGRWADSPKKECGLHL